MSLINQMLQDLDARRASATELALVPRYVRALPREARSRLAWWFAGAGALIGVAGATAWHLTQRPAPAAGTAPTAQVERAQSRQPPPTPAAQAPAVRVAAAQEAAPATQAPAPPQAAPAAITAAVPLPISAVVARAPAAAAPPAERDSPRPPAVARSANAEAALPAEAQPRSPPSAMVRSKAAAAPVAGATADAAASPVNIDKRVQQPTAQQLAETDHRDGTTLLHQGRLAEAQDKFRSALHHLPGHGAARQALFGLLLEAKRLGEAEQVLQEGLRANLAQPNLAMALARMQVDRGDTAAAIETLQKSAASAAGSADYIAFIAALLQRQGRHAEAVEHYQTALSFDPGRGVWSMGMGISLQALNRNQDARAAFRRALAANALSPPLQAYVDQQLRQLQ